MSSPGPEEGPSASSSIAPSFFYEDQVYRVGKNGELEFGLVTENWQMYSSDEEDEEDGPSDKVPQGHVAVTWFPKNKDEVVLESKVKLSDRSLMPGDVVRRLISGKDAQCGYCSGVHVFADVQVLGSKKVIPGVLARNLQPVQLQPDIAIYLKSWIGVIRDVKYLLSVKFNDNSSCFVESAAIEDRFQDVKRNLDIYGGDGIFYPGQKLRGPWKCLKDADFSWISDDLKRAKDKKVVNITVIDVTPMTASVQWQWQTPSSSPVPENNSSSPPPETISGDDIKNLKCLNIFESCTMQIGDISFYTPTAKDNIIERNDWKKLKVNACSRSNQLVEKTSQPAIVSETAQKPEQIDSKTTLVNKDDLDDEYETLESTAPPESNNNKLLTSIDSKNSHSGKKLKLCTRSLRKKKLKKAVRQQPATEVVSETQAVVETLYTRSLVDVIWQDGTQEEGVVSIELYPIHHLDDHEFFPGDFVVLADSQDFRKYGVVQSMDHAGRVANVKWFEAYSFTGDQKPNEVEISEMSVYDLKDHPDFRFRPGTIVIRVANWHGMQYPAGQIMDNHPDGQVRVCWADGEISPCWPQDLFRLGDYDSDDGEIWDENENNSDDGIDDEDDEVNSDSSWETETEDEPNNEAADNCSERYEAIGKLIGRIQTSLVSTRELIIASSSITIASDSTVVTPVAKLGDFDERGLTKKLLQIYKDCQYLDKIMGTKYFDVDDLKKWHKDNETSTAKSSKIFEHITRLFKGNREISPSVKSATAEPLNLENSPAGNVTGEKVTEDSNAPEMVLYELCSVILSKLVEAHTAYEKRFGSFKNEHISANMLLKDANKGIEALAECFGKQFFKRHLIKAGCSRLHHEISYRVVLSSIDESFHASSSGGKSSKKTASAKETESGEGPGSLDGVLEDGKTDNSSGSSPPQDSAIEKDEEGGGMPTLMEISLNLKETPNFSTSDCVPDTHRYRLTAFQPQNQRVFLKTVQKELVLLQESLPEGIVVKGFEDRMDLYSVMVKGPEKTPYEDGIFLFDIHLPPTYSAEPPMVHYISFCTGRLNPNLYEEGKICLSLLGTWNGKGTEVWTSKSSLLQLLVSLQGLILCPEPYYNEAGYEKQKGTQQGAENSRMYNENVLIKLVQSMSRMITNPPPPWQKEVISHIKIHGPRLISRCSKWVEPELSQNSEGAVELPGFSLFPVSKGFSITLKKTLASFGKLLETLP